MASARSTLLAILPLLVACTAAPRPQPPAPRSTAATTAATPDAGPPPAPARAVDLPDRCVPGTVIPLVGHTASIVNATCPDPEAQDETRVELQMPPEGACIFLVGARGKPQRTSCGVEAYVVDVKGKQLVQLRPGGPPSLLIMALHARHVGMQPRAEFEVYELVGEEWHAAPSPHWPARGADMLGDGKIQFPVALTRLNLGECFPHMVCGAMFGQPDAMVYVDGFETWDGKGYATDLEALRPVYQKALAKARAGLRAPPKASGDTGEIVHVPDVTQDVYGDCHVGRVRMAAEVYLYRRILGEDQAAAIQEADQAMKGFDMTPCKEAFRLGSMPTWVDLRKQLLATSIPKLGRK
jgi:hypothetical protein